MSDAGLAERLVAILGELIAAPSAYPPGDSRAVCAVAARRLSAAGLAVETHSRATGVDNVVARLGTGSPSLVFTAHVDTVGPGDIAGGFNTNIVPSSCTAEIDRRLLPAEDRHAALTEMRALLDAAGEPPGSWEIALTTGTNGFSARRDGPAVSAFAVAVEACTGRPARFVEAVGASDARWFADDGIELIGFGPGGGVGHEADESVAVAQLVEAARIQRHVVESLLGAR
jgi:acetylornithine deacetylase/succinyl-diaminopimelate desuccinylase-like protein